MAESFHQLILCSQQCTPVTAKNYRKCNYRQISNAYVMTLRKRYSQEFPQTLPICEEPRLLNLLIRYHHQSQLGNIKVGRTFHNSDELTLKQVYTSQLGFYCYKLLDKIRKYTESCVFCNLIRPRPVILGQGTKIAGLLGENDRPYSHVSVDNTVLGYTRPFGNSHYVYKKKFCLVCSATMLVSSTLTISQVSASPWHCVELKSNLIHGYKQYGQILFQTLKGKH